MHVQRHWGLQSASKRWTKLFIQTIRLILLVVRELLCWLELDWGWSFYPGAYCIQLGSAGSKEMEIVSEPSLWLNNGKGKYWPLRVISITNNSNRHCAGQIFMPISTPNSFPHSCSLQPSLSVRGEAVLHSPVKAAAEQKQLTRKDKLWHQTLRFFKALLIILDVRVLLNLIGACSCTKAFKMHALKYSCYLSFLSLSHIC